MSAYNNLGRTLNQKNNKAGYSEALKWLKKAVALRGNLGSSEAAQTVLALLYRNLGDSHAGLKKYKKAIEIDPFSADAYNNLGNALRDLGQLDAAVKCYEKAFSIKPDFAVAHHHLSIHKKYTASDPHIAQMQSLLSTSNLSQSDRTHLCFALAKANEDLGKQDELFEFLHEGNRLRKEELNYSLDNSKILSSTVKKMFSSTLSLSYEPSAIQPVFIVGMLRSGTSLVEQIVASHHAVYGAGELNTLADLIEPILNDHLAKDQYKLSENLFVYTPTIFRSTVSF